MDGKVSLALKGTFILRRNQGKFSLVETTLATIMNQKHLAMS